MVLSDLLQSCSITSLIQSWYNKNVTSLTTILLYHDCIGLVGTTFHATNVIISTRLLQVVNSLFQTSWQLGASSTNTTCWRLVGKLATRCEIFTSVMLDPFSRVTPYLILQMPSKIKLGYINLPNAVYHFHRVILKWI
jgi:hypothetical protein